MMSKIRHQRCAHTGTRCNKSFTLQLTTEFLLLVTLTQTLYQNGDQKLLGAIILPTMFARVPNSIRQGLKRCNVVAMNQQQKRKMAGGG
jgi:hypothetical protein